MKATELRIGNWVLNCKEIIQITGSIIYEGGIEEYLKPIELTVDWLKKFGFVTIIEYGDHDIISKGTFLLTTDCAGCWFYDSGGSGYLIKYVHQLQNLYFALTGIELTLNE